MNTKEQKFEITVIGKDELTEEEMYEACVDFSYRLQGYQTEVPECLKGSQMYIKPIINEKS